MPSKTDAMRSLLIALASRVARLGGQTPEEALANIQEAVQLYVEDLMEDGD